jgi:hypothetical protein
LLTAAWQSKAVLRGGIRGMRKDWVVLRDVKRERRVEERGAGDEDGGVG